MSDDKTKLRMTVVPPQEPYDTLVLVRNSLTDPAAPWIIVSHGRQPAPQLFTRAQGRREMNLLRNFFCALVTVPHIEG